MENIAIYILSLLFCLPLFSQENTAILCGDGIDNDGDGLIDCFDPDCSILPNDGCSTCTEGTSFADTLIEYIPGCPLADPEPMGALGVSDWVQTGDDEPELVFLGEGGSIKLGFINNILTNSGNSAPDLWVFEIGLLVEPCDLELKPANAFTENQLQSFGIPDADADGYYEFGRIAGATSSLDIDAVISGFQEGELQFDAVEIIDAGNAGCSGGTPGADIDAVCALSSINTVDCAGVPNGTAQIDECGECLEPTDPAFNQSCADCAGVPNGTAEIDECGECLEPTDPAFNQSCAVEKNIYIPNVFSPNGDGINDRFQVFKNREADIQILNYMIFDRWGELVYEQKNIEFNSMANWWNGIMNGKNASLGVYVYLIEIECQNGELRQYTGEVTLIK